jgi:hypothetical protein
MAKGCVFRKVGAVYPLLQCKTLPNGSALPNIPTKYPRSTREVPGGYEGGCVPAEGPRRGKGAEHSEGGSTPVGCLTPLSF